MRRRLSNGAIPHFLRRSRYRRLFEECEHVRIACQTITWGETQRENFPAVFGASAEAGYTGLEIGFRHIQPIPPATLADMLAKNDLTLVATHVGGNLQDRSQASGEQQMLEAVLDYLNAAGCSLLMYSGLRFESLDQFQRDLESVLEAADRCRERGVQFLYHNHDWEFANDGRIINTLLDECGPDVGFCPDIGWIAKGGADVLNTLNRMGGRVGAVHFKDFAGPGAEIDTVMLGDGLAPLRDAAAWAARHRPDVWLIAEQDQAAVPPRQAIEQNARFLRGLVDDAAEEKG
jgi:sugar phosphate isomerase/epimerase